MSVSRVAIACCRASDDAPPADLYPDPDATALTTALAAFGSDAVTVSWDDPTVRWDRFNQIVISSTWDSVDRPAEYLTWVDLASSQTVVINPAPVIHWGLDKVHQRDLAAAGIPVIATTWVEPGQAWEPPSFEYVIKPAISAGGRSTARYSPADTETANSHVGALHRSGQTVMIQPYLATIDEVGETDLIYIAGSFSRAVGKLPALRLGAGVSERPWEQMAWSGAVYPQPAQLAVAAEVVEQVGTLTGSLPVYARVDLLDGPGGQPLLLEVEVVDPNLSLDVDPPAANRLARAILNS